jgi:hypothetical protein
MMVKLDKHALEYTRRKRSGVKATETENAEG